MVVKVEVAALKAAVALAHQAVPKRITLPITGHIALRASEGVLELEGNRLDLAIRVQVPAEVSQVGGATVPADTLKGLVDKLSSKGLTLESAEGLMRFVTPGGTYEAKTFDICEFPKSPDVHAEATLAIPAPLLHAGLERVAGAVADRAESRLMLTGVKLEFEEGCLRLIGACGPLLAVCELAVPVPEPLYGKSALVWPDTLSILKKAEGVALVTLGTSSLSVTVGATTSTCRFIEGEYPRWRNYMPKKFAHHLKVKPTELLEALERVLLFSQDKNSPNLIEFSYNGNGTVAISAYTDGVGLGDERVEVVSDNEEPFRLAFNGRYLETAFGAVKGEAEVQFSVQKDVRDGTQVSCEGFRHVVMPVRLKAAN